MGLFTVVSVVDGDTFDVTPRWEWHGQSGTRVRIAGYDAPESYQYGGAAATNRLRSLILDRPVELREAHRVDRGRLVADVYLRGLSLAEQLGLSHDALRQAIARRLSRP